MGNRRESLLDAALSNTSKPEDRLTEIFATVLSNHRELAEGFTELAGLQQPAVSARFDVETQVRASETSTPDLIIRVLSPSGRTESEVWSEHKIGALFQDQQRERYVELLSGRGGTGRLAVIVANRAQHDIDGDWESLTWQDIGELIDSVGRRWQSHNWQQAALAPEAPAKQRLLYELLWYLKTEGLVVIDPLNSDMVHAYPHVDDLFDALDTLLEKAAEHVTGLTPHDGVWRLRETGGRWVTFEIPDTFWLARVPDTLKPEITIEANASGYWSPTDQDKPALGAGFAAKRDLHPLLSARAEWITRLEAAGYTCSDDGELVHIYRTKPMQELLDSGDSLATQARQLGGWAQKAFQDLAKLDPGALTIPLSDRPKPSRPRDR